MKKHFFILFSLSLFFNSCISSTNQNVGKLYANNKNEKNIEKTYQFKNDTILQIVKITSQLNDKIEFVIKCKDLRNQKESTLKGIAILVENKNGNAELGEDENGFAYVVAEYKYTKGDCWIYILIDREKKDKLTVEESSECKNIRSNSTPFNSVGILRKQ
jgi:predicted hydrocarbon binding protein